VSSARCARFLRVVTEKNSVAKNFLAQSPLDSRAVNVKVNCASNCLIGRWPLSQEPFIGGDKPRHRVINQKPTADVFLCARNSEIDLNPIC
jgi:hypothetical protein